VTRSLSKCKLQASPPEFLHRPAPAFAGFGHARLLSLKSGGAGENPAPTVKVWMGEEFEGLFCYALFL